MLIPPKYHLTPEISQHLQVIEAARAVIDTIVIPPEVETNIRRQTTLKSSLFSARIEGNPLTLEELSHKPSSDQKKQEVLNILHGLTLVHQRGARDITATFLLELHTKTMHGLISPQDLGQFRTETSAIFNTAGIAIYLPPPPRTIGSLINKLVAFTNASKEPFVPIRAILAHYTFEKIHPFLDGNGRVGRLLLQAVLAKSGYGMKGLVSIEEALDRHRTSYYNALMEPEKDVTDYVTFMLEALAQTATKAKELVLEKQQVQAEDYLLPRRAEILAIIKEHKLVAFDLIRRRFLIINERTLRYDLKKLLDAGLIHKRGTTNGVYYEATHLG